MRGLATTGSPRRCGAARSALAGADKVIVTLGDEPLITPAGDRAVRRRAAPARATYDGRARAPGGARATQIAASRGSSGDRGARDLLGGARTIECGHLCSGRDVDTPNDLEAIRNEARAVV